MTKTCPVCGKTIIVDDENHKILVGCEHHKPTPEMDAPDFIKNIFNN